MLEFLEKIALKAAHPFCMKGDDWNWSTALFISVSSSISFFIFCHSPFLTVKPAPNLNCSLCLASILLFYILLFPVALDKSVFKSLRRCKVYERNWEDKHTHTHVFSFTYIVCINKSKLYMGIEAKCHGNHQ